jgi:ribonuclease III
LTEPATRADDAALEAILGHRFRDRELLGRALTHPSLAQPRGMFERLEFLGDRVLGLVTADMLLTRFPGEAEGDLARRHAVLVSRDSLAAIAMALDLGAHLRLARGEEGSGGRKNPGVLADALEAVIGALYRDGGLDAARRFIAAQLTPVIERALTPPRDPKTALQEWAQGRGLKLPTYRTLEATGPAHQPHFRIEVAVEGFPPQSGEGASKRAAEREAAERLLAAVMGGRA